MRLPHLPSHLPSKKAFFDLWHHGRLGNKLRSWSSPADIPLDLPVPVMFRHRHINGGGGLCFTVPRSQVSATLKRYQRLARPPVFEFNECAPDERAILQGEVFRGVGGLETFCAVRKPEDWGKLLRMRDVLPQAKPLAGLAAEHLLRRHLSPASFQDVLELLELFQDHVIELTAYDRHLGDLPGRNTIIWEVRAY